MAKNWGFVTIASVDPTGSDDDLQGHLWVNDTNGATFVQVDAPSGANWLAISAGGSASDLAAVLAVGNDTGGVGIVDDNTSDPGVPAVASIFVQSDAALADATTTANSSGAGNTLVSRAANSGTDGNAEANSLATAFGIGTANADQIASTVDNIASAIATATASGLGGADVSRTATTGEDGNASANASAFATGLGIASADSSAFAATSIATTNSTAISTSTAISKNIAQDTGVAGAAIAGLQVEANSTPVAYFNLRSIGAAMDLETNITYSEDEDAPPAQFVGIIYKDTTAVTGGVYVWDGSTYQQISDFI